MLSFIRRNLDPSSRLGEVLFALIMALGFTASVRLGLDESEPWELFVSILGCNVAWAIVDAVMFILTELFERGRRAKLIHNVRRAGSESRALEIIDAEVDASFGLPATEAERERANRWLLELVHRSGSEEPRIGLTREDLLGGAAVALAIVLATLPVVLPFLVVTDAFLALRLSNAVAVAMLFLLGVSWGKLVGRRPIAVGTTLMSIGLALVLVTVALGG